jgi:tRNA (adenine37-N6)-methyltransferase
VEITPIGTVRTCFGDKFAVPRQPVLCPSSWGELTFHQDFRDPSMLRDLAGFSHLWLIFGFHATAEKGWSPTVRPPRLGGNRRVGVFATRSTFRPNGLGLSLVTLEGIESAADGPRLRLGRLDLIDGTPVYDIKPYLPFTDSAAGASAGFAETAPVEIAVSVNPAIREIFDSLPARARSLILECLAQDPRPAVQAGREERQYGARLCGHEIGFRFERGGCQIVSISPAEGSGLNC